MHKQEINKRGRKQIKIMCYPLRKKISVSLLTTFIFLLTAFQSANASGIPYTFNQKILQGKVIRVLDGDTIEIKTLPAKIVVYEVPIRVRLINIDAPEKKQPFGRWSTSQLKTLVAGKQVTVSYSLDILHALKDVDSYDVQAVA